MKKSKQKYWVHAYTTANLHRSLFKSCTGEEMRKLLSIRALTCNGQKRMSFEVGVFSENKDQCVTISGMERNGFALTERQLN